jgi:hypothetical protein
MAASVRLPLKQSTTPSIVDGSSIPTANGFGQPNYPSCHISVTQIQILRLLSTVGLIFTLQHLSDLFSVRRIFGVVS